MRRIYFDKRKCFYAKTESLALSFRNLKAEPINLLIGSALLRAFKACISGNYAIVGASREDEDVTGGNTLNASGSAYVFERDASGNWNEVQKIVASDREIYDWFGVSVSINGNYAIVGAFNEDHDVAGAGNQSQSIEQPAGVYLLLIEAKNLSAQVGNKAVIRLVKE